jgi:hypothetical protein
VAEKPFWSTGAALTAATERKATMAAVNFMVAVVVVVVEKRVGE